MMLRTLRRGMALGLAMLAMGGAIQAQDQKAKADLAGAWSGVLEPGQGVELLIAIKVEKAKEGYKAQFASLYQGSASLDVESLKVEGDKVTFKVPKIAGSYEGKLAADGKTIDGEWSQGGAKLALNVKRTDPATLVPPEAPAALLGAWEGKLSLPGNAEMKLILRVEEKARGEKKRRIAVMDSPDQGVPNIPVTGIRLEGDKVTVELKGIGGEFKGTLDKAKKQIKGEWSQGGGKLPLTLAYKASETPKK